MASMLPLLRQADCPQTPLAGWSIGILGFGNQGRAHALNLRDSGYEVVVGVDGNRPSAVRATADGFSRVPLNRLLLEVDLVALLAPDELHRSLVEELFGGLRTSESESESANGAKPRAKGFVLAHGFSLVFDRPEFPLDLDLFVVAPAGPGLQLRDRYAAGGGVPALLAVDQDGSGEARARGRAYASAIGSARAGVLETTVRDEVEIDLFGEQAVLCGGMNALAGAAFDTLVEAGYSAEMAYLECVHQIRLTAELVEKFGIEGMRRRISTTALYGDLEAGESLIPEETRVRMRQRLSEIREGHFAKRFLARRATDPDWVDRELTTRKNEPLERAGRRIRELFEGPESPEKH